MTLQISLFTKPNAGYQTRDGRFIADGNGIIPGAGLSSLAFSDLLAAGCLLVSAPPSAPAYRNLIDGGDFSTNPWQRDCAGLATSHSNTTTIAATATHFPDRWFAAGGASSAIQLTKTDDTTVPGFTSSCLFSRKASNANTTDLNFGHIIPPADVAKLQGQPITLSFWARTAADYSGGALTVATPFGTGNAANCTAANMLSGSWTGDDNVVNTTQALSAVMTRYSFSGVVPPSATELGVQLTWTPVGTAGAADGIYLNGFQLEPGGLSPYQFRDALTEMERCQRFAHLIPEPADTVPVGVGSTMAINTQIFVIPLPVTMVKTPVVSIAAGSFKIAAAAAAFNAATGLTVTGATHTPNSISLKSTYTAAAGLAAILGGGGGTGYILASADF